MKKQAVTLETIAQTLENMQLNTQSSIERIDSTLVSMQSSIGRIDSTLDTMQLNIKRIDSTLDNIQRDLSDTQDHVHFLVKNAVMRDDVHQIVRDEMSPFVSRAQEIFDKVLGKQKNSDEEILACTYRIDRLEQFVQLPNTV